MYLLLVVEIRAMFYVNTAFIQIDLLKIIFKDNTVQIDTLCVCLLLHDKDIINII